MRTPLRRTLIALAVLVVFLVFASAPAPAEDVVIMNDGYTLRGRLVKEKPPELSGKFDVKAYFDAVGYGPKYIFFSGHAKKQLAAIEKGVPKKEMIGYRRGPYSTLGRKLPPVGELQAPDWKENWSRTMKVKLGGGNFELIEQKITYLGPDSMYIFSTSHTWSQAYDTREFPPENILKLLRTHPDLQDPEGGVDPIRRLKIATFMKDTGWYTEAREELAKLKKDLKTPWPKEATERYDQLMSEIETAESKLVITELEAALTSGRYRLVSQAALRYEPKSTDPKDLTRMAEIRATIEQIEPQFELTARLLRNLIDDTTGANVQNARGAAVGGFAVPTTRLPPLIGDSATLVEAAYNIYSELHPDSASRLELFRSAAEQSEKDTLAGKQPATKPAQLFALAVNGWLRGKNGASPDPVMAVKTWNTRQFALAYLRQRIGNERTGLLRDYLNSTNKLPPLELAQIVSLLPPIEPEPLNRMSGRLLSKDAAFGYDRIYLRNTGPVPEDAAGYDYYMRLPDEYHHGRTYPLVVALTDPAMPPEKMLASLADMSNKYGYIVVAPKWTTEQVGSFDYTGKNHPYILGVIKDMIRRFNVDSDRVFLFGIAMGGTLALDLGLSHPDLFAGLTLFGPTPVYNFYQYYWTNAQKLPIFTVTGDQSGVSSDSMRKLNEYWLPNGYPSLMTVYKGRGAEWFMTEVPNAYDWMNRKVRARGVASLRLNDKRFDAWKSMRLTDNRFYWLGIEDMHPRHEFKRPERPDLAPIPAGFRADIRPGNKIVVDSVFGVKRLSIWLERDMIDWDKDVIFAVDGGLNVPRKGKMEPDLKLMFEELYRTGDKKMLFFGKVEIRTAG